MYIDVQSIQPTKLIEMYVLKVHYLNLLAYRISIVSITKPTIPKKKKKKKKLLCTFSLQLILLNPKIYTYKKSILQNNQL